MVVIPIIIGVVAGGITYLVSKGASVKGAVSDIDYKISVKNFRIHKVTFPTTIDTRFELDIKLVNPSRENFKISHPDIFIKYNGNEIGRSIISNKVYELKARSETTIKNIEFQIDISSMGNDFVGLVSEIISNWNIGKGLKNNLAIANKLFAKNEDAILKKLFAKINLSINNLPISYETSLAGGTSLGKFMLGYSPISAIDRTITPAPQFDKYFPVPKGTKKLVRRNASVHQTVHLMVDVVNNDYKLIEKASQEIFKRDTVEETAKNIFDWIYKHIKYNLEVGEQLRNPATTYHLGQRLARKHYAEKGFYNSEYSADCDDISIFIASILKNLGIPYMFRIADYTGEGYSHVYALIPRKDKAPIIIDPVYHAYNREKEYIKEKTYDMNKNELSGVDVYYLSGINDLGSVVDDTYNYLLKSRTMLAENPASYEHIADVKMLIEMYDYAIKHWNTPKRNEALDILEQKEEQLIAQGYIRPQGINGLGRGKWKGFFSKLKDKVKKGINKLKSSVLKKSVEQEVNSSNYANNPINKNLPAQSNTHFLASKDNGASGSLKRFFVKYKAPISITAGTLFAFGTYAVVKSVNKKKAKENE